MSSLGWLYQGFPVIPYLAKILLCNMKEQVNHPEHYSANGIEAIDVIDAYGLNFNLGNAIKYILRADKKGNKKIDLEKSVWYLNREIDKFHG
jgi:hypothetical protein